MVNLHKQKQLPQREILNNYVGPFLTFLVRRFSHIFAIHLLLFINNYGQVSVLKVAYIFKVYWAQSCLMVA